MGQTCFHLFPSFSHSSVTFTPPPFPTPVKAPMGKEIHSLIAIAHRANVVSHVLHHTHTHDSQAPSSHWPKAATLHSCEVFGYPLTLSQHHTEPISQQDIPRSLHLCQLAPAAPQADCLRSCLKHQQRRTLQKLCTSSIIVGLKYQMGIRVPRACRKVHCCHIAMTGARSCHNKQPDHQLRTALAVTKKT